MLLQFGFMPPSGPLGSCNTHEAGAPPYMAKFVNERDQSDTPLTYISSQTQTQIQDPGPVNNDMKKRGLEIHRSDIVQYIGLGFY